MKSGLTFRNDSFKALKINIKYFYFFSIRCILDEIIFIQLFPYQNNVNISYYLGKQVK